MEGPADEPGPEPEEARGRPGDATEGSTRPVGGSTETGDAPTESDRRATDPADAFGTVANETRVEILGALWEAEEPCSFSELRDAVGTRDSGQFNYHLGKLEGRFVRKTDEDGAYVLTYAGRQVVGSIESGVYTDDVALDPIEVGECHDCGGTLLVTYEEDRVEVACRDCGTTISQFGAPPTLLRGFEGPELPDALGRWVETLFHRSRRGFCPQCSGPVEASLCRDLREEAGVLGINYTCEVCGLVAGGSVGATVLDHPAVVAFHADHGIDLRETPVWSLHWLFEDHATVESEDPLRVRVTPEVDGDRVSLVLDGEFSVVSVDRDP